MLTNYPQVVSADRLRYQVCLRIFPRGEVPPLLSPSIPFFLSKLIPLRSSSIFLSHWPCAWASTVSFFCYSVCFHLSLQLVRPVWKSSLRSLADPPTSSTSFKPRSVIKDVNQQFLIGIYGPAIIPLSRRYKVWWNAWMFLIRRRPYSRWAMMWPWSLNVGVRPCFMAAISVQTQQRWQTLGTASSATSCKRQSNISLCSFQWPRNRHAKNNINFFNAMNSGRKPSHKIWGITPAYATSLTHINMKSYDKSCFPVYLRCVW